jgi:broad specificity phosphatase PhoE
LTDLRPQEPNGPAIVWLYRHGPVEASASEVCLGWTDALLADPEKTAGEARRLGRAVGRAAGVYVSDLRRALGTARPLAATIDAPLYVTRDLREMHFGEWENQPWREVRDRHAAAFLRYFNDWENVATPGGESFGDLRARTAAFWRRIAAVHEGDTLVVVSHGMALAALATLLLGWTPKHAMKHILDRGHYALLDRTRNAYAWNFDPAKLP